MPSLRYMRLQALLPLIIHRDEPRSASGDRSRHGHHGGRADAIPGLEQRVCAELLPAVARAAPLFHGNFGAGTGSRASTCACATDAASCCKAPERYDLITLEPPPPSAAGVVNLYSTEFYRLAATRLRPAGWSRSGCRCRRRTRTTRASLVRSFLEVFPHASLWTTEFHEMLLVGSLEPIELDVPRIAARFNAAGGVAGACAKWALGRRLRCSRRG